MKETNAQRRATNLLEIRERRLEGEERMHLAQARLLANGLDHVHEDTFTTVGHTANPE